MVNLALVLSNYSQSYINAILFLEQQETSVKHGNYNRSVLLFFVRTEDACECREHSGNTVVRFNWG